MTLPPEFFTDMMQSADHQPGNTTNLSIGQELTSGQWGQGEQAVPWSFRIQIAEADWPAGELCTAAFCICVLRPANGVGTEQDPQVMLIRHHNRDWELPGGHIDEQEDPEAAARREVLEEASLVLQELQPIGLKEVRPPQPIPKRDEEGYYPFPVSYVPYYVAWIHNHFDQDLAPDVAEAQLVPWSQAQLMVADGHNHDQIIKYGLQQLGFQL